eukprot:jgi/Mesvir1/792/Mv17388-RA.2
MGSQRGLATECLICFEDKPEESYVIFAPCSHTACTACVIRMRNLNIKKADAGVHCPFCRQVVDSYMDVTGRMMLPVSAPTDATLSWGASDEPQRLEADAGWTPVVTRNATGAPRRPDGAVVAGAAVGAAGSSTPRPAPVARGASIRPHTTAASASGTTGGVRKMDRKALLEQMQLFDAAMDAGKRDKMEKRLKGEGVNESVADRCAFALRLLRGLAPHVIEISTHNSATFLMQVLLTHIARNYDKMEELAEAEGDSLLGELLLTMGPKMAFLTSHLRGNFVMQTLIAALQSLEDLTYIIECLKGKMASLSVDAHGQFVIKALICKLGDRPFSTSPPVYVDRGLGLLPVVQAEMICRELEVEFVEVARNRSMGNQLVRCIQSALQSDAALSLAKKIANAAPALIGSVSGNYVCTRLLRLANLEVREISVIFLKRLRGHVGRLMKDLAKHGYRLAHALIVAESFCQGMDGVGRGEVIDEIMVEDVLAVVLHGVSPEVLEGIVNGISVLDDRHKLANYRRLIESTFPGQFDVVLGAIRARLEDPSTLSGIVHSGSGSGIQQGATGGGGLLAAGAKHSSNSGMGGGTVGSSASNASNVSSGAMPWSQMSPFTQDFYLSGGAGAARAPADSGPGFQGGGPAEYSEAFPLFGVGMAQPGAQQAAPPQPHFPFEIAAAKKGAVANGGSGQEKDKNSVAGAGGSVGVGLAVLLQGQPPLPPGQPPLPPGQPPLPPGQPPLPPGQPPLPPGQPPLPAGQPPVPQGLPNGYHKGAEASKSVQEQPQELQQQPQQQPQQQQQQQQEVSIAWLPSMSPM